MSKRGQKWYGNFQEKVPENPENPESESRL